MEFKLRDYQQQLFDRVLTRWQQGQQRLMVQLPTGGGKTILFGAIARELLPRGQTIVILAHREELLTQAAEKVATVTGAEVGIIKAGYSPKLDAPIQVASVQTLSRRPGYLNNVGLVVVDEAHHTNATSYRKILAEFHEALHLGVTATPIRTDGSGFEELFQEMIAGPTVSELVESGYLCPLKLYADPHPMKTRGARTTGGDFNPADLLRLNGEKGLSGNLVSMWKRYARDKRTVVFAINVAHSEAIAARFNQQGISAEHLDGNIPAPERRAILERFSSGKTLVLVNCNLVSEGFDLPAIEAVQIARPTQSLALWLQQIGRALRIHPGKAEAIAIDHTRNWLLHGLPTQPRIWSLDGVRTDDPPTTHCPDCSFVFETLHHRFNPGFLQCPNCQKLIPSDDTSLLPAATVKVERKPFELPEESHYELEEVSPAVLKLASELLHLQELIAQKDSRGRSREWVVYHLAEINPDLETWEACARELGYSQEWAAGQYRDRQALVQALEYKPQVA
ncbi:MAG: DEAD/DEAH box helicase [Cyanobacteria bacterium P01_E01_bin.34]